VQFLAGAALKVRDGAADYPVVLMSGYRPPVLVLDDDHSVLQVLSSLLRLHGFVPFTATTLDAATSLAAAQQMHAFIVDVHLRDHECGLQLLQWVRERPEYARAPVLVLTGQPIYSEYEVEMISRHGSRVFFKPDSLRALIQTLKQDGQQLAADSIVA
jgi:DNA-binding response OmpR family regulator